MNIVYLLIGIAIGYLVGFYVGRNIVPRKKMERKRTTPSKTPTVGEKVNSETSEEEIRGRRLGAAPTTAGASEKEVGIDDANLETVLDFVKKEGRTTSNDIERLLGVSSEETLRYLKKLEKKEEIIKKGDVYYLNKKEE